MGKILRKIRNSELAMRIKEKFFLTKGKAPATKLHYLLAMERFRKCKNKKPASQIKREIQICKKFWKCYPYHYFTQNLFLAEKEVTEEELINYIPHFFWFMLFLPHYISQKYSIIGANKIVMEHLFKSLNINKPKLSLFIFNRTLYSSTMECLTFKEARTILERNCDKFFVKPAEGSGGKGIIIFNKNIQNQFVTRQNVIFNENFLTTIGGEHDYVIQPGLIQDREFSQIYPHSVNTCRIITENLGGEIRIVCAMLRLGRNHSEIDNISSGGISTHINIENGNFGDFAISYQGEKFEQHPDTHFIFHNNKISRWNDIQRFTINSAEKLPFFSYLGWDIALTVEGEPVAIEVNSGPAIDIIEMTSGGLREAFHISNPDHFWKNPGKRI